MMPARDPDALIAEYRRLRGAMLDWLVRNDANGHYDDESADAQGWDRLTVDDCAAMLLEAVETGAVAGNSERFRCRLTAGRAS